MSVKIIEKDFINKVSAEIQLLADGRESLQKYNF